MLLTRGLIMSHLSTRKAAASFHQNFTSPPNTINFVSSPSTRGSLDVLFSSLFTILLCAWTLQHLNIPRPLPKPTKFHQILHQCFLCLLTRTKFLLLTLICPELWIGKAFQGFMVARRSCREMKELAKKDGVEWTMTHAYFANLGGLKFKVKGEPWLDDAFGARRSRSTISLVSLERVYEIIRKQRLAKNPDLEDFQTCEHVGIAEKSETVVDGGKDRKPSIHSSISGSQSVNEMEIDSIRDSRETPPSSISSSLSSEGEETSSGNTRRTEDNRNTEERDAEELFDPYHIYPNADQLKAMREWGVIDRLPQISGREIAELRNTGVLVKTISFVQVSWFVLQIIARAAKHLPISQLEIATLAFVVCAIFMQLLFWSVPRGITTTIEINRDQPIRGHTLNPFTSGLLSLGGYCGFEMHFWPGAKLSPDPMYPPPNDVVYNDGPGFTKHTNGQQHYPYGKIGIALAGTLFGVIHCIAWRFSFPTSAERTVWRIASLYTGLAFISWPVAFLLDLLFARERLGHKAWHVSWSLTLIANLIYAVARLSLLVLVFRCLFFLPAGAFFSTWADEIPHFS